MEGKKFSGNPAVFLDRDGVINQERGVYTTTLEEFVINDGVFEALKKIEEKGYLLIVITNQGGISKGIYSIEQLQKINEFLVQEMQEQGIHITDIFYCPHHPDITNCLCRKPEPLMLERAIATYQINASASYFIGDTERDAEAARRVGVKPILIESNTDLLKVVHLID